MKKGASPIIATILILLIAVTLGGGFYIFANQSFDDVSETTDKQIIEAREDILASIRIESVGGDKIFIRNNGGNNIENNTISIFLANNILDNIQISPAIIEVDKIATIIVDTSEISSITPSVCDDGEYALKVTTRNTDDSTGVVIDGTCKLTQA